ncbi:MAG: hypothetical protein HQK95_05380 [Nitrospirae bacterium]|nr:hypothetical protein [Nitrospirota bacterium]
MKKIGALIMIVAIVLVVGIAVMAYAESKMFTLLDNATVGVGPVIQIPYKAFRHWYCEVTVSGRPDNVTFALEGNISGGALFESMIGNDSQSMSQREIQKGLLIFYLTDRPAKAMRATIVSMPGGVNPRVAMMCLGVE